MGCPVRKVVCGHDGSALMKEPELAYDIVQAVIEGTDKPVSVKFRLGYTSDNMNYVEFGQEMQSAGAQFITLHARTRAQMYSGHADWAKIKALKDNVDVPVFANGDIKTVDDAIECLDKSGADGVAIGRGAGEKLPAPSLKEKFEMMRYHIAQEVELRGERVGIKFFRKFYPYYISGIKNASKYRGVLVTETDYKKLLEYFDNIEKEI